jgi:hypothetical protein
MILLLGFFWLILFPAIAATLFLIPHLLHMLLGIESIFVQSNLHMINTTFWTVVLLLSLLLLDPLVKAAYVLRCFYGVSLSSGTDLRVDLRRIQSGVARIVILVFLLGGWLVSVSGTAWAGNDPVPAREVRAVVASEMNSTIYEWRQPRIPLPENHEPGFLAPVGDAIMESLRWLGEQIQAAFETLQEWLQKLIPSIKPENASSQSFFREADPLLLALYLISGLGLSLAGIWLYRSWRRRLKREKPIMDEVVTVPDLEAEDVSADELPADRWTALAHDLLAKGEVRLALRALVLGALARLADDGYLKLARYKSNRDYLREIFQRGQELAEVRSALDANMTTMEGIWYGDHTVDGESITLFLAHHERIMRYGQSV